MKLAIIADDFTGSNDTGVQFAKEGLQTVVTTDINQLISNISNNEVVVFDTESRFDDKDTAYKKVNKISKKIQELENVLVYKKLDSTFRGNIGAEIDGCMNGMGYDFAVVIPALPSNGRKTIEGHVKVNGQFLHETEIAKDPKTPVKQSYIPDIIKNQCSRKVDVIKKDSHYDKEHLLKKLMELKDKGTEIIVFDAESNVDLMMLSDMIADMDSRFLIVGTAGLAEYITDAFELKVCKSILSIIGSVSDVTREQIIYANTIHDFNIIDISIQDFFDDDRKKKILQNILQLISEKEDIVIRTAKDKKDIQIACEYAEKKGLNKYETSEFIAQGLGEITGKILNEASKDLSGLFITGGDTLIKIANYLNIEGMKIIDEVLPAIPIGRFVHQKYCDIQVVTKAGAFGNKETFSDILDYLR
ncbi:D-threonate kinase [Vallitalea sediminicola]